MRATGIAKRLRPLMSSENAEWGTPREFFRWLNRGFNFTVDVCASSENAKLRRYYDRSADGLAQSWAGETFFCNPEYGDQLPRWAKKARASAISHERTGGVLLVPSRVDTDWWISTVEQAVGRLLRSAWVKESRVLWLRWAGLRVGVYHHDQRLPFEGMPTKNGAPFPSSVIILTHPTWKPPDLSNVREWQAIGHRPPLTLGMLP